MEFKGFDRDIVTFFEELAANNEREWFLANRERYDNSVMNPSRSFVSSMGPRLQEIAPDIVAVPLVNKALFRLNRDVRFSRDKSPYKTHMGIFMWQGNRKRMENPGYYFHLEPEMYMVGVGLYMFSKELMERYREAVDDDKLGPELEKAVDLVRSRGYSVGDKNYKRVPRGYDKDHPRAELLMYGGLTAIEQGAIPDWVFGEEIIDQLMRRFEEMSPIQEWLIKAL